MFKLEFETDNAAFEEYDNETAGLIRGVADRVQRGDTEGVVRDSNGNTVGSWSLS